MSGYIDVLHCVVRSYHNMLCHCTLLCHALLCHAMPCHAMLCHAVPYHAPLCQAVLCHALLGLACHSAIGLPISPLMEDFTPMWVERGKEPGRVRTDEVLT